MARCSGGSGKTPAVTMKLRRGLAACVRRQSDSPVPDVWLAAGEWCIGHIAFSWPDSRQVHTAAARPLCRAAQLPANGVLRRTIWHARAKIVEAATRDRRACIGHTKSFIGNGVVKPIDRERRLKPLRGSSAAPLLAAAGKFTAARIDRFLQDRQPRARRPIADTRCQQR